MKSKQALNLTSALQLVLVLGGILLLVALATGYCQYPYTACNPSSDPARFGHSSDEVEYSFAVYSNDCSASGLGFCSQSCQQPDERAVSGNCSSDTQGWAYAHFGVVDNTTWSCIDLSHTSGVSFKAEVICLKVNAG